MVADAISSNIAETFTEGTGDEVNLVKEARFFHKALPRLAQYPEGVRLIQEKRTVIGGFDPHNLGQWRSVPQHAVYALYDNEGRARTIPQAAKALLQILRIIMPKPDNLSATQAASIINTRMGVAIYQDDISRPGQTG